MKPFFQLREELQQLDEAEDKAVTKKIAQRADDHYHIATHGHEHVYAGDQPDHESQVYHVHNTKTNKTHDVYIEHGGESMSHKEVHDHAHEQTSGAVSKAATKSIHKDLGQHVM